MAIKEVEQEQAAMVRRIDPQALIQAAVEHGAGVETMERLVALAQEVRAQQAREAWHEAMAAFQASAPVIRKDKTADTGRYTYRYAGLDTIMAAILPGLGAQRLSVSWGSRQEGPTVYANCRVSHAMGHHEDSGEVAIPIEPAGSDGKGAPAAQRVGIAMSYAKRYALLGIIGLAPEDDPDAQPTTPSKPTVQMPRAKGEPAPAPAPVGYVAVESVTERSGEKNGKQWTLYTVRLTDGTDVQTFSESVAEAARGFAGTGEAVILDTEQTPKGVRILGISSADQPAE